MLIINAYKDWADNFDYPIISIFDNVNIIEINDILTSAENKGFTRFGVPIPGTVSYCIEFTICEARELVNNACPSLSVELARQLNKVPAVDIVSFILESPYYDKPFRL